MYKLEENLLKILNICYFVICFSLLIKIEKIVSVSLLLTFVLIFIIWIKQLRDCINKIDLLVIIIFILSTINVFINATMTNTIINFNYIKKLIMFCSSLIYFSSLLKINISKIKIKKTIKIISDILAILFILFYLIYGNRMYIMNGIISNYLCFNFSNPNLLALFLTAICMSELNFLLLENNKIKKIIYIVICLFLIYFILETKARICSIVIILYVFFMLYYKLKNKIKFSPIILKITSIFPIIFVLLYFWLINNIKFLSFLSFLSSEGKELSSRQTIWMYAIENLKKNPIFGAYSQISNGLGSSQMHNTHLDIITSYGLIVFVLFCVWLFLILTSLNKKSESFAQFINIFSFIMLLLCGISEAALFAASLGLNVYVGNFLLLANSSNNEVKKNENNIY